MTDSLHGRTGFPGNPPEIPFPDVQQMQTNQVITEGIHGLTAAELQFKALLHGTCTDSGRLQRLHRFQGAQRLFRRYAVFNGKGIQIFGKVTARGQEMQNVTGQMDRVCIQPAQAELLLQIFNVSFGTGGQFKVRFLRGTPAATVPGPDLHGIVLRGFAGRDILEGRILLNGLEHVFAQFIQIQRQEMNNGLQPLRQLLSLLYFKSGFSHCTDQAFFFFIRGLRM